MYIVAIAWIYVVLMMAITEETAVAGAMTFALYGILPLTIVLYIMNTGGRRRLRAANVKAPTATIAPSGHVQRDASCEALLPRGQAPFHGPQPESLPVDRHPSDKA